MRPLIGHPQKPLPRDRGGGNAGGNAERSRVHYPTLLRRKGKGKGSHMGLAIGDKETIVQQGELSPKHVARILRQIGLPKNALD